MKVLETLIRSRPAPPGRHGDPDGPPEVVEIPGCRVAPLDTREGAVGTNTVVTGFTLQLPPGTSALPTDSWFVRGFWRSQVGEPFDAARKGVLVTVQGGEG